MSKIIPGFPECVGVLPSILWFSSLFCLFCLSLHSLPFIFLLHPGVTVILSPPHLPLCHPLCGLTGPRPYGLEEDVRQYEQDLAKRLYQARVRASQGTPEAPQPPISSTSSSATSQLRSAPRPQPPGPDARHHGVVLGCFDIGVFC